MDYSLQSLSVERAGPHGLPTIFSPDGLVHLLALNSGGPHIDATNFAPLLANIMLSRCTPVEKTFTIEDLHWVHGVEEEVPNLPSEKVKEIANFVLRARISGENISNKKFQLKISRLCQSKKQDTTQEFEDAKLRAHEAEEETTKERSRRTATEEQLVVLKIKDLNRRNLNKLVIQLIWRIPTVILISVIVYLLIDNFITENSIWDIVSLALSVMVAAWGLLNTELKRFFRKKREIPGEAHELVDKGQM